MTSRLLTKQESRAAPPVTGDKDGARHAFAREGDLFQADGIFLEKVGVASPGQRGGLARPLFGGRMPRGTDCPRWFWRGEKNRCLTATDLKGKADCAQKKREAWSRLSARGYRRNDLAAPRMGQETNGYEPSSGRARSP